MGSDIGWGSRRIRVSPHFKVYVHRWFYRVAHGDCDTIVAECHIRASDIDYCMKWCPTCGVPLDYQELRNVVPGGLDRLTRLIQE